MCKEPRIPYTQNDREQNTNPTNPVDRQRLTNDETSCDTYRYYSLGFLKLDLALDWISIENSGTAREWRRHGTERY